MSNRDPYRDIRVAVDPEGGAPGRVIDWRIGVLLVLLAYVLVLAWVNAGTGVTVQIPPFIDAEVGLVWLVLAVFVLGGALALVAQAGYRSWRRQRQTLEAAARADFATDVTPTEVK